jgi:hypothetical protein
MGSALSTITTFVSVHETVSWFIDGVGVGVFKFGYLAEFGGPEDLCVARLDVIAFLSSFRAFVFVPTSVRVPLHYSAGMAHISAAGRGVVHCPEMAAVVPIGT